MVGESLDATESRSDIYTDTAMQITGWVTISLMGTNCHRFYPSCFKSGNCCYKHHLQAYCSTLFV